MNICGKSQSRNLSCVNNDNDNDNDNDKNNS